MTPEETARELRKTADAVDAARRPSLSAVRARLAVILAAIAASPMSTGRAARELLEPLFPGDAIPGTDAAIGARLMSAARRAGLRSADDAEDAIMSTIAYLLGKDGGEGETPFDRADTPAAALNILLSYVFKRAKDESMKGARRRRWQEPLEDAEVEPEGDSGPEGQGDEPEYMDSGALSLDDQTAVNMFAEDFKGDMPLMLKTLTPDERSMFEVIFEDGAGDFVSSPEKSAKRGKPATKNDYQGGVDERKVARLKAVIESGDATGNEVHELERLTKKLESAGVDVDAIKPDADASKPKGDRSGNPVKENMGQSTALKERRPDLFKKNEKRWSGFVGDLRKKLLAKLEDYIMGSKPLREEMRDLNGLPFS